MDLGLKGKKVIMNGGAARPWPHASVKAVPAAEGADVGVFQPPKEDKIEAAKAEIDAAGPGKVFAEVFDMAIGDRSLSLGVAAEGRQGTPGGCDIFVHHRQRRRTNRGRATGRPASTWTLKRPGLAVETLTPWMPPWRLPSKLRDSGAIVMLSSPAALETFICPNPFNAIKAALITYASQLSQAYAAKGILVNTVSPGAIYYKGGNWE